MNKLLIALTLIFALFTNFAFSKGGKMLIFLEEVNILGLMELPMWVIGKMGCFKDLLFF